MNKKIIVMVLASSMAVNYCLGTDIGNISCTPSNPINCSYPCLTIPGSNSAVCGFSNVCVGTQVDQIYNPSGTSTTTSTTYLSLDGTKIYCLNACPIGTYSGQINLMQMATPIMPISMKGAQLWMCSPCEAVRSPSLIWGEGLSLDTNLSSPTFGTCIAKCNSNADCAPGYQCQNGISSQCPIGQYSIGFGCQPCPTGTYSSTQGAAACTICPAGTGTNGGNASPTTCGTCPIGTYSTGQPRGIVTQLGQYSAAGCKQCPAGKYSNATGASSCNSNCLPGTGANTGASSQNECGPCPIGTYSTGNGAGCQPCPANTCATSASPKTTCTASDGKTTFPCAPLGSCSNSTYPGATACTFCPNGQGSSAGSTCTTCPGGVQTANGITSASGSGCCSGSTPQAQGPTASGHSGTCVTAGTADRSASIGGVGHG